ncbi:PAS domain-containing hybrid sensor histidine kinase/response regulator [Desulfocurvus sp. DL9XJH121]
MGDSRRTKKELIAELHSLRREVETLRARIDPAPMGPSQSGENLYRMLAENIADVIWSTDKDLAYTYLSPSVRTILGYAPRELLGTSSLKLLTPESRKDAQRLVSTRWASNPSEHDDIHSRLEILHRRKDGSEVWLEVLVRTLFDGRGEPVGLVGVSRDISQRREAERLLRRSEAKFRNVLENASLAGVSLDRQGRLTFANNHFLNLAGWPREEALGSDWVAGFVPPDQQGLVRELLDATLDDKQTVEFFRAETDILTRNGDRLTLLWSSVADRAESGIVTGITSLGVDVTGMRRTQARLMESELRYRRLFKDAAFGIFVINARHGEGHGTLMDVNKAALDMLGYTREELDRLGPRDLVHPDDFAALPLDQTMPRADQGETLRFERRYRKKDGTWLPVHVTMKRIPDTGRHLLMFQDISESKRAKARLEEFRLLLTAMADNMIDMLWAKDLKGRYLFANKAARERLLLSEDIDPIGKDEAFFARRQHALGHEHTFGSQCLVSDRKVLDSGRPGRFLEQGKVQGRFMVMDVQKSPLFDAEGRLIGTVGTGRDITEQRRAQEALAASERELQLTLDAANDCIWSYDAPTEAFRVSPRICAMLGWDPAEKNPSECLAPANVHPEDQDQYRRRIQSYLHGRASEFSAEFRLRTRDGDWRWFYSRGRVVEWGEGEAPLRMVGAVTDITELKKVQEDLTRAKEAAEHATRIKSEFLANMSHELRTPLNGVFGMLQLMQGTELSPEQDEYVHTALSTGRSLLTIINDVLDFSKLEAGQLLIASEPFDLRRSLEMVMRNFTVQARDKGLDLRLSMDRNIPRLLTGDKGRIRQVLFNLVGNAVKFCDRGSVLVDVSVLPRAARGEDVRLLFHVSDTGIGIPEDMLEYVFKAFTQVDGAATRRYSGTGLGLGIVRRLVAAMHGSLAVDSEPGRGTDIYFSLPFGLAESPAPSPGDARPEPPSGLRVLLVEDEKVNQMAAGLFLKKNGHKVACADNGAQALEMLEREAFDCVLMDIQMPVMDGLSATRAIRESDGPQARVPVIAMTAHAMRDDQERFLQAGMDGYIAKPMDMDELQLVLAKVLPPGKRPSGS